MEKTLQQALGSSATQDADSITLDKTDLNLTDAVCTADQVIAAIMIKASPSLTQANFTDEEEQRTYITDGFASTVSKFDTLYVVKQKILNLAKPEQIQELNPNDY